MNRKNYNNIKKPDNTYKPLYVSTTSGIVLWTTTITALHHWNIIDENNHLISHGIIWIVGLFIFIAYMIKSKKDLIEKENSRLTLLLEIESHKLLEKERGEALSELNQIFNTASTGIAIIDRDYNFVKVNRGFEVLFNIKSDDIIGKKCHDFWDEPFCSSDRCPMKQILTKETNCEHITCRSNRGQTICLVSSVPFYDSQGKIIGILDHYIDISEMKKLERDLIEISEGERRRIGRNLHDELGQILTGSAFLIEALKNKLEKDNIVEGSDIVDVAELIDNAIIKTRLLSRGLNPVNLEKESFDIAIEEMISETTKIYNTNCSFENRGTYSFKDTTEVEQLYYIARESLNNAVKHGKPDKIEIIFSGKDDEFELIIEDNGDGFTNSEIKGMGLKIMKYRAEMIGAEFLIKKGLEGVTISVKKSGPAKYIKGAL